MGKVAITPGDGEFYQTGTLNAGSQSIAHGLGKTPTIVLAESEQSDIAAIAKGTHDATDLEINPASTGVVYTIYAK